MIYMLTIGLFSIFCVGAGEECPIYDIPKYDLSSYAFWESDYEKREYFSEEELEAKGITPIYAKGYQYIPVDYFKGIEIENIKGPMDPLWTTYGYGVMPTHNYPYPKDATVYYSHEANQYGVLNPYLELETKDMELIDVDEE